MAGETNLAILLKSLSPELRDEHYVFLNFPDAGYGDHAYLQPLASFGEVEGLTLVVPQSQADEHGFKYSAVFSAITLKVHSSLEAVGLTAAFSATLAQHDISANVVAGYFHDHVFVQSHHAMRAIKALQEMA